MTSPLQLSRAQTTSHVTVEDPQERTVDSGPQGTICNSIVGEVSASVSTVAANGSRAQVIIR